MQGQDLFSTSPQRLTDDEYSWQDVNSILAGKGMCLRNCDNNNNADIFRIILTYSLYQAQSKCQQGA